MRMICFILMYILGLSPFIISYPSFTLYVFLLSAVFIMTRNVAKNQAFVLVPCILSNLSILLYGILNHSLFLNDSSYSPYYNVLFILSLLFAGSLKRMQENLTKGSNEFIVGCMMSLLPLVVYFVLLFINGNEKEMNDIFFILYASCFSLLTIKGKNIIFQIVFLVIHVVSLVYVMNYAKSITWFEWTMMFAILSGNYYQDKKGKENGKTIISTVFKRRAVQ